MNPGSWFPQIPTWHHVKLTIDADQVIPRLTLSGPNDQCLPAVQRHEGPEFGAVPNLDDVAAAGVGEHGLPPFPRCVWPPVHVSRLLKFLHPLINSFFVSDRHQGITPAHGIGADQVPVLAST